jgi:metal iron transporter
MPLSRPFHHADSDMSASEDNDRRPWPRSRSPLVLPRPRARPDPQSHIPATPRSLLGILKKYSRFIGPGLMVSVAYMDPGNYSTAVAAGSAYKYKLLFSILLSNCLAIFLQILLAKLGAVTGLDLAANCRANLPFKYNIIMYLLAELAIIATDLAEVVGTAIALNILFKLPLFAGVILTVVDVLVVLMAYRPDGPLLFIRIFEAFVSVLVGLTVICFIVELHQVSRDPSIRFSLWEVFKGFLPNAKVVDMSDRPGGNGLFLSLAILGATVMPHLLYLGSGVVQSRLKDYDVKHGYFNALTSYGDSLPEQPSETLDASNPPKDDASILEEHYRPSIHAINDTMTYTIVELVISLFTVALFVNSAILIVAGATLRNDKRHDDGHLLDSDSDSDELDYANADLFTIYNLLTLHISPTAGLVFAMALLFSGQSAGVVCTLAGQMVLEGFLLWTLPPVTRRLITRGLAIAPCLVVVTMAGREGLANVLNTSQVVLSVLLPVVSAPLIWFTSSKHIMRVPLFVRDGDEDADLVYDTDDRSSIFLVSTTDTLSDSRKPVKFKVTEPAIRLQDLRKSHPCAGWEEEDVDFDNEHQRLMQHSDSGGSYQPVAHPLACDDTDRPLPADVPRSSARSEATVSPLDASDTFRVKGYKDMSNGPATTFMAVTVWGFITCLNLFLIGSMLFGSDVHL